MQVLFLKGADLLNLFYFPHTRVEKTLPLPGLCELDYGRRHCP